MKILAVLLTMMFCFIANAKERSFYYVLAQHGRIQKFQCYSSKETQHDAQEECKAKCLDYFGSMNYSEDKDRPNRIKRSCDNPNPPDFI